MKHLLLFSSIILSGISAHAQLTVNPGTNMTVMPATKLIVDGGLAIADGGHLDNYGVISFDGDLNNTGNSMIDGELVATGDRQLFYGRDSFAVNTLRIDNNLGVKLESKLSVINTLELDKGVLYTNTEYPVNFLSTAASPLETVDGYIDGTAIMSERDITGSKFNFLGSNVSSSTGNKIGKISLRRTTGEEAPIQIGDDMSIAARWEFSGEEIKNSAGAIDLTVSWLPAFDNEREITTLALYGNSAFNTAKFQSLDLKTTYPTQVNGLTEMRSYQRNGLDDINRVFTLAGKNNMVATLPKVHITTFPNPATTEINLLLENFESWADDVVIKVTDAYGKVFQERIFLLNGNLITIKDIGYLPTGMYRLFISRGQLTKVVNFVKN